MFCSGRMEKMIHTVLPTLTGLFIFAAQPFLAGSAPGFAAEDIHLPVVEACSETSSGLKTTWKCVTFGSYPCEEIVGSEWNGVDDYALQEGDVIRDDDLYAALEDCEWQDDTAKMDGVSYLRIEADENAASGGREQHYNRENGAEWHYFRISPIRWRVLDIQNDKALLLADRMPDSVPFHSADEDVNWGESTLRSWLNGYGADQNRQGIDYTGCGFFDLAFTEAEREVIVPTDCRNLSNRDYGTDSGDDTQDRVFVLSNEEVFEGDNAGRYGFFPGRDYDDPAKRFTSTLYAKYMGAWWSPVEAYAGNSFWFMRTSGYTPRSVTYVCDFGYIYSKGTLVTCSDAGVLPAMWVDLDRAGVADAGERSSTDILKEKAGEEKAGAADGEAAWPALSDPVSVEDENMPGGMYTVWNAVEFGHYPQSQADEKLVPELEKAGTDETELENVHYIRLAGRWFTYDPIVWRVLDVSEGTVLLMADRGIDCVPYHAGYTDVYWEDSDLRAWLNGTGMKSEDKEKAKALYGERSFLETAFSGEERQAIVTSLVPNANNYYFGTACGSGTHDRVFILSEEEVFSSPKAGEYGFCRSDAIPDAGRRIVPTDYAAARGAWQSDQPETAGAGFWLLRTNGYTPDNVVYVGEKGYLYNRGIPVTCPDACIVPVIRVRIGQASLKRLADITTGTDENRSK